MERPAHLILAVDPGIRNLACCIVGHGREIVRWETVDLCPSKARPTIADVVVGACAFADSLPAGIAEARIEQQPNQNQKMKCLSHVLQALFLARRIEQVRIVPARVYKQAGGTYASRKRAAVDRAAELLGTLTGSTAAFTDAKKRDDLADSLLLALYDATTTATGHPTASGAPEAP